MSDKNRLLFEHEGHKYELERREDKLFFKTILNPDRSMTLYELVYDKGKVKAVTTYDGKLCEHEICTLFDVAEDNWIDFFLMSEEMHPDLNAFLHAYHELAKPEIKDYKEEYEKLAERLKNVGLSDYIY